MAQKKYRIHLSAEERDELEVLNAAGKAAVSKRQRAQILPGADENHEQGVMKDRDIARAVGVSVPSVEQSIGRALKKNELKPWRTEQWCLPPEQSAAFVSTMEDVLEVYARPRDPRRPLVCQDEFYKQLIADTREPVPAQPGKLARVDYEYERCGMCSAFMA